MRLRGSSAFSDVTEPRNLIHIPKSRTNPSTTLSYHVAELHGASSVLSLNLSPASLELPRKVSLAGAWLISIATSNQKSGHPILLDFHRPLVLLFIYHYSLYQGGKLFSFSSRIVLSFPIQSLIRDMRLLKIDDSGELVLEEFYGDRIPDYAILSHTWGDANDEVTFKDLADHTAKNKKGYRKIDFCGKQAANDNLRYFWIDTCCIDKSSSSELQESINSMFRWYREAKRCYVYLSDVSENNQDEHDHLARSTWKSEFRKSKWFTRGWTLQELIAPSSVEFFSSEGTLLCDKKSMEQQIHKITGIDVRALRGDALSTFDFDKRMSWVKERNTTREEDMAYSLLGIFDIQMPLIYSEGKEKALLRLEREYWAGFRRPLGS